MSSLGSWVVDPEIHPLSFAPSPGLCRAKADSDTKLIILKEDTQTDTLIFLLQLAVLWLIFFEKDIRSLLEDNSMVLFGNSFFHILPNKVGIT
jgi:hypothetical protein